MAIIGIDATNLSAGGGITHLKEILAAVEDPGVWGFEKAFVYASEQTLQQLPEKIWLIKKTHPLLNRGLIARSRYLFFHFMNILKKDNCDILFNPGGGYTGSFRPYVTMCQNMLVFDAKERARYRYTRIYWRLKLLEIMQMTSMLNAGGVIFISAYAKKYVTAKAKLKAERVTKIHHGIAERFFETVKPQQNISAYSAHKPYTLLYVSIIDLYKHQWQVAVAVHRLRTEDGFNIRLELAGPAYPPAKKKLDDVIAATGSGAYIHYNGNLQYEELHKMYHQSDAFVFASSCENMPNILLEAMNAGLPIAGSDRNPMPEFLKDAGWYFDPEDADSIYNALKQMITDPVAREANAHKAQQYAGAYNWQKCASETFAFLQLTEKNGR